MKFGRLGARQSNRLVISPSVVGTGVALGSAHWQWDPGDCRSVPSEPLPEHPWGSPWFLPSYFEHTMIFFFNLFFPTL